MNSHVYIEVEDAPFPTTRVDPKKHNIVGEIELPRGYRLRAVQADVSWFYFACQNTAIQSVLDLLMRLPIGDLPRSLVSNIQVRNLSNLGILSNVFSSHQFGYTMPSSTLLSLHCCCRGGIAK